MSTEFESLRNKWFCNTCRISFDKGRDAIQAHERSQKHKRNKDRETKFQMHKHNKREKTEEEKYEEEVKYLNERNQRMYAGAPPQTENQPKPKGAGQGGAGANVNRDSGYGTQTGKPGFPGGPKQNKNKDVMEKVDKDLGISFRPQDMGTPGDTWTLMKDEDTGKLCFYNRISGNKHFERPRGVKLPPYEEKKWQDYVNNPQQNVDVLLDPKAASGQVGQWEEVTVEEDFYAQHAVDPRLLGNGEDEEEPIDSKEVELEEKFDKLDELDQEQIEELLNLEQAEHGKSVLRSKTDKLKRLIDADVETVFKPTFKKDSDILFKRSTDTRGFDGDDGEKEKSKGNNLFKKRKGGAGAGAASTGRVILGFEDDDEDKKSQ